ncbi:hypothetical protein [Conexibacter sp. CPCC 206217]|uniref:hypothetical protein n=1 Tax=Conexibacter sp. CPCC 206217 TaxID=3064574 RepID=UPI00272517F3|nr:hypothetical protein [Conexibacter sp. CPCC 206217]MDO8213895.1 hypothetical protein [Conexibacter sp. CPCC 206217]
MRAMLAISPSHLPAIFDALLTLFSVKADALHRAAVSEPEDERLEAVRESRSDLLDIDELLEQLDFSAMPRAIEISGEREVLALAVHQAIRDAAEHLSDSSTAYPHAKADIDQLRTATDDIRDLLPLLHHIEIEATAAGGARP